MNKARREQIQLQVLKFNILKGEMEKIRNEEEDYYDNIPENLIGSINAENSEDAIDSLNDVIDAIDDIIDSLNDIR